MPLKSQSAPPSPSSSILTLRESYYKCGLIPVIGSGLSIPMGLPDWGNLLLQINEKNHMNQEKKIKDRLQEYDYLGAADILLQSGISELQLQFQTAQLLLEAKQKSHGGDHNYLDLAELKRSRFLTTNYDEYLNDFIKGKVMYLTDLDTIEVNCLRQNSYNGSIIPIHGEISRPQSIILTRHSYDNLYGKDTDPSDNGGFEKQFQILRHGFTFLFMGFSFDDVYFEKLFQHLTEWGFPARHYILFDRLEQEKNAAKIVRLENNYHITAIYYDAARDGHVGGIRKILSQVMEFEDDEIDLSDLKIVKRKIEGTRKNRTEKQLEKADKLLKEQQVGKAWRIYRKLWEEPERYSEKEKRNILYGLSSCCGIMKDEQTAKKYLDEMKGYMKEDSLSFNINESQLLINMYRFREAGEVLENWRNQSILAEMLYDIAGLMGKYLQVREDGGKIPVYDENPLPEERRKLLEEDYEKLKEKYVNPATYNLRDFEKYQSRYDQYAAYYWLSIAAGQLFHKHREALEYLYRSFEIEKSAAVYEELAQNYLAIAVEKVRYQKDSSALELDKNALMKAKECFELAILRGDPLYRKSVYEKSGLAYLRVLYYLRLDYIFCRQYPKVEKYIKSSQDRRAWKEFCDIAAEVEARYHRKLKYSLMKELPEERKVHIKITYYLSAAGYYSEVSQPDKARSSWNSCVKYIRSISGYERRKSLMEALLDSLFFLGRREEFEKNKRIYDQNFGTMPVYEGFLRELAGDLEQAYGSYRRFFEEYPDVMSFNFLKNFLERQKRLEEVYQLYQEIWRDYKEIVYDSSDFWFSYIFTAIRVKDMEEALSIYREGWKNVSDLGMLMEVEMSLRTYAGDYSNVPVREKFIRTLMRDASAELLQTQYQDLLALHLANMHLDEAEDLLIEMQKKNIQASPIYYRMYSVLREPQIPGMYMPGVYGDLFVEEGMGYYIQLLFRQDELEQALKAGVERIILPSAMLCALVMTGQISRLQAFPKVYVAYRGLTKLQFSLLNRESRVIRETLRCICEMANTEPAAPSLAGFCERKAECPKGHPEYLQMKCFSEENDVTALYLREVFGMLEGVKISVSMGNDFS